MGFLKKNKDEILEEMNDEIFHDRVERKAVEELIESIQVLSKHVDGLLEEVVSRDDIVEQLENQLAEQLLIIENLSRDIENYIKNIDSKEDEIKTLTKTIDEQQEKIDKRDAKIKRFRIYSSGWSVNLENLFNSSNEYYQLLTFDDKESMLLYYEMMKGE